MKKQELINFVAGLSKREKSVLLEILETPIKPVQKVEQQTSIKSLTDKEITKYADQSMKREFRESDKIDKIIAKQIESGELVRIERVRRSSVITTKCNDCNKEFNVSSQLMRREGKREYFICNDCSDKTGRSGR